MSVKEFKAELTGLGAKLSASRIQKLTHLAIKLSLKYAEELVVILEQYIKESSTSTRLGAISVIDSICRGAAKLHEKDAKWENVYFKLIPERLGPVIGILFDCSSKDKEKMKRMVKLWKESAKLLPVEFSERIYDEHFANSGPETQADNDISASESKEAADTPVSMTASGSSSKPPAPKRKEPALKVKSASNSPARPVPVLNSSLLDNLSPVDPSAIAGLSALLGNIPNLASGISIPVLPTTANGSLGLTGLAMGNAGSSSILAGLSALSGQGSISIGLPGATPANLLSLLGQSSNDNNSNGMNNTYSSDPRQSSGDPRNQSSSSRQYGNDSSYDSPRHDYNDPRQQHRQSGDSSYMRSQQSSHQQTPYGGNSMDPRQQYQQQQQQSSSYNPDPRYQQQSSSYNNDPRQQIQQQQDSSYSDPRQRQYGVDPRQQQQSSGYGSDPRSQQNHQSSYRDETPRRSDSYDSRSGSVSGYQQDSYRSGGGSSYNPQQQQSSSYENQQASRYPPKNGDDNRYIPSQKRVAAPQLPPGPDCAPSIQDPSVPKDCIKILSRTLFISGIPASLNQAQLKEMMEEIGRIESVRITAKLQAFVKVATRKEAEAIKQAFQGFKMDQGFLKVGWGNGYGPKDGFDFHEGATLYEISRIPDQDIPFIESAPRGGGTVQGGFLMEEPNVPLDLALAGRASGGANSNKRPLSANQGGDYPPKQRWS